MVQSLSWHYFSIYYNVAYLLFLGWNFFKNKGHYCRTLGFNLPRILRGQTPRVIKYANMLIMFWGQLSGGEIVRGWQLSGGQLSGGGGGNCPGGNCPGGNCPGGNCPGGNCAGGNCPGGNCPDNLFIYWSLRSVSFSLSNLYSTILAVYPRLMNFVFSLLMPSTWEHIFVTLKVRPNGAGMVRLDVFTGK